MSDDILRGWDALDIKLKTVYGDQEPKRWGTLRSYAEGGPDPLDGVSAYLATAPPHWHYVTYGFSELYEKESDNQQVSGWGFELSFRLQRSPSDAAPPEWPVLFLQTLARYVFNTGEPFDHGHYIRWGGPICKETPTKLEALVFSADPALGQLNTPNGTLKFLTAIGITADEHKFAEEKDPEELLRRLLEKNPLGVVDLQRG